MIKRYRQIPVELSAVQWNGDNLDEIKELTHGDARVYSGCLFVKTPAGELNASVGDYITKSGTEGYPLIRIVTPTVFNAIYEEVENHEN